MWYGKPLRGHALRPPPGCASARHCPPPSPHCRSPFLSPPRTFLCPLFWLPSPQPAPPPTSLLLFPSSTISHPSCPLLCTPFLWPFRFLFNSLSIIFNHISLPFSPSSHFFPPPSFDIFLLLFNSSIPIIPFLISFIPLPSSLPSLPSHVFPPFTTSLPFSFISSLSSSFILSLTFSFIPSLPSS